MREDLNSKSTRVMVVLDPIKLVITNYPEGQSELLTSINNPEDESAGSHDMIFSREIYIERDDFMIDAPKKYFRLGVDKNVRLKGAYIIKGESYKTDEDGNVTEVHCSYYPDSKSGSDNSGVKAKGTMHWVECESALDVEVRNYDRLFTVEKPLKVEEGDYLDYYNKESLIINDKAKGEAYLSQVGETESLQFMRKGYYVKDIDSTAEKLVFNKTVGLRDSWAKKNK